MKRIFQLILLCATATYALAQKPVFTNYEFEDESIIQGMSDNGKWAVASGGEAAQARLIDLDTHKSVSISSSELTEKANDVSNDGLTVVGCRNGRPAAYNVGTQQWTQLETKSPYDYGNAYSLTPDGKLAVGTLYYDDGYKSIPALWDLTTGKLVTTKGLPTKDMSHTDQGQMDFRQISSDGNTILGCMSYSYLPTSEDLGGCFFFLYDVAKATYQTIGYTPTTTGRWTPLAPNMLVVMSATMSNNGQYVTGTAHIVKEIEGSEYASEYKVPFLFDAKAGTFSAYDETTVAETYGSAVANDGTLIDVSPEGNPVREWSVRSGQYWFSFSEILQQKFGTNIKDATTYSNTGTVNCISDDAKRIVSFPDPYKSYVVDLPVALSKLSEGVKLLGSYQVTPAQGSEISALKNASLTFDRNIQALGTANAAQILDNQGNTVYNSVGFTADGKTLSIRFRKGSLTAGQQYKLFIPAGSIALEGDANQTNADILIPYTGRADQPVRMISAYPADGTAFSFIDYSTSPVMLTFDTDINISDGATANLFRNDEQEPFCSLTLAKSDARVALYPSTLQYLFEGSTYRIEVSEGAVTDVAGNNPSQAITLNYKGNYVREISANDTILFSDNFNSGLGNFMQWCGDLKTPTAEMQGWDFTQGMAWGLVRDDEGDDLIAASHSMYLPAAQSDDWLVIPQLYIPDKLCTLHFQSQSYLNTKNDVLKVIVWESNNVYSTLSQSIIDRMKQEGTVVLNETQSPGLNEGVLAGEWRDNDLSLSAFAGKNVYIAFVNDNKDQSAIFIDNLEVRHNMNYLVSLDYEDHVINKQSTYIKGTMLSNKPNQVIKQATFTLLDSNGATVSAYTYNNKEAAADVRVEFSFPQPLPLSYGVENRFTVSITVDGEEMDIHGSVKNLAFQPQKRVVLEEYTGRACGNCPMGILAFEKLQERYGNNFIPISIHTYNNDPLSAGLSNYTSTLGIDQLGAPSGIVNRNGVGYPAKSLETDAGYRFYFSQSESESVEAKLWADYVAEEINTPTDCDIKIASLSYNAADGQLTALCQMRYALNADNQTVNLFTVLLEDNLTMAQQNYMASISSPDLGEWGLGGRYGQSVVSGYLHQDVARNVSGLTINGTGGYLPSSVEAGRIYEASVSVAVPANVQSLQQCKVVVMMIDANTGKVINAAVAKNDGSTGIEEVENGELTIENSSLYNLNGQRVSHNYRGIIIKNGKKYIR